MSNTPVYTIADLLKGAPFASAVRAVFSETFLPESRVTCVTSDSREAQAGCIFVAIRGEKSDGHAFVGSVLAAGATLVIGEQPRAALALSEVSALGTRVPYVQVADSRLALAWFASAWYGHPGRAMKMLAVTGTSGKTTTTYLLESILAAAGERVGVKVAPHGLRRSFITILSGHGTALRDLQKAVGHESITTTERYNHENKVVTPGEDMASVLGLDHKTPPPAK